MSQFKGLVMAVALAASATQMARGAIYPSVIATPGSLTVKAGEGFLVGAPSNPSTGYSWTVRVVDSTVVTFKGSAFERPPSASPGAGGQTIFSFEARREGLTTLTLSYRRPWEKNVKPASTLVFTIHVTK